MDDKTLADRVVALGVGTIVQEGSADQTKLWRMPRSYSLNNDFPFYTDEFVRDWRVAGALMEKCEADGWDALIDLQANCQPRVRLGRWQGEKCSTENTKGMGTSESLPRAIIEACVESLASEADND